MGDAILPIYFGDNFEAEVPKIIHVMNGRQYNADHIENILIMHLNQ